MFYSKHTSKKFLQQRKAFTSFIALFDNVCCFFFAVGGVKSPWKGEYREPRHLSLNKENSAQTSLSPTVSPVSELGSDPKLSVKVSCGSPLLPPPSLEQTEEVEGPHWNEGRELPETCDPPPLSSTPLPLKSCSHVERATTISEQELQQLEIGEHWAGGGIQLLLLESRIKTQLLSLGLLTVIFGFSAWMSFCS